VRELELMGRMFVTAGLGSDGCSKVGRGSTSMIGEIERAEPDRKRFFGKRYLARSSETDRSMNGEPVQLRGVLPVEGATHSACSVPCNISSQASNATLDTSDHNHGPTSTSSRPSSPPTGGSTKPLPNGSSVAGIYVNLPFPGASPK